jgi:7,8-dihydroneopterin aldolase/epimerase/oxygenase
MSKDDDLDTGAPAGDSAQEHGGGEEGRSGGEERRSGGEQGRSGGANGGANGGGGEGLDMESLYAEEPGRRGPGKGEPADAEEEDADEQDTGEEDEEEYEEDDEDEDRERGAESVTIEITGLSLYTHHGVSEAEREIGQRLMLDLRLEVGEADATFTDRIEDTIDYGEVCQLVALIAQQRSHRTLERLCSAIADRLLADYELEGVWVKAAKPEPPIPLPVQEVSVEIWREAEE